MKPGLWLLPVVLMLIGCQTVTLATSPATPHSPELNHQAALYIGETTNPGVLFEVQLLFNENGVKIASVQEDTAYMSVLPLPGRTYTLAMVGLGLGGYEQYPLEPDVEWSELNYHLQYVLKSNHFSATEDLPVVRAAPEVNEVLVGNRILALNRDTQTLYVSDGDDSKTYKLDAEAGDLWTLDACYQLEDRDRWLVWGVLHDKALSKEKEMEVGNHGAIVLDGGKTVMKSLNGAIVSSIRRSEYAFDYITDDGEILFSTGDRAGMTLKPTGKVIAGGFYREFMLLVTYTDVALTLELHAFDGTEYELVNAVKLPVGDRFMSAAFSAAPFESVFESNANEE